MQLHVACLCLDCAEIHDAQRCPVCGSESFAYISRWIPVPERARPRPVSPSAVAEVYQEMLTPATVRSDKARWLQRGVLGVAAVSVVGWLWRRNAPPEGDAKDGDQSEGRKV